MTICAPWVAALCSVNIPPESMLELFAFHLAFASLIAACYEKSEYSAVGFLSLSVDEHV